MDSFSAGPHTSFNDSKSPLSSGYRCSSVSIARFGSVMSCGSPRSSMISLVICRMFGAASGILNTPASRFQ